MKKTIDLWAFREAFLNMGRGEQFSYNGLEAIYDYETMLEECCENETELDVIGICCTYIEYESLEALQAEHDVENVEDLEEYTNVICNEPDCIIIENY